jgi:flagellar basal body rod protein FlgG
VSNIFEIAQLGLLDSQRSLDAISTNAASAALPGFRRHVAVGRPFDAMFAATTDGTSAPLQTQSMPLGVDLHAGAQIATGRALDVAIEAGDLFFALSDGEQLWLTRSGAFHVNEDGVLVGERGLRVMGDQGDIPVPGEDVVVEADGRITQAGSVVGQLQLYRPNDRASLAGAQGTLIAASDGVQLAERGTWRLRGGALEASNTDNTREMLGMISLKHQFESLSRVVQAYDGALRNVIQKLAEA